MDDAKKEVEEVEEVKEAPLLSSPDIPTETAKHPVFESHRQLVIYNRLGECRVYSFDSLSGKYIEREKLWNRTGIIEEISRNSFVTLTFLPAGVQIWEFIKSDEYRVRVEFPGATHFLVFGKALYLVYFHKCILWDLERNEE